MEERILLQELLQRCEMVDALMFLLVSSAKRPKRHQSTAPLLLTAEVGVRVGWGGGVAWAFGRGGRVCLQRNQVVSCSVYVVPSSVKVV